MAPIRWWGRPGSIPAMPLDQALAGGVVAERLVIQRLGLKPGDVVRLGQATAGPARGTGRRAGPRGQRGAPRPEGDDRPGQPGCYRPGAARLPAGTHAWRVALPPGADARSLVAALAAGVPGYRVGGYATPASRRLAWSRRCGKPACSWSWSACPSLLVGGIGGRDRRARLAGGGGRARSPRCAALAGRSGVIFAAILIQVLGLCAAGTALGVAIGAALPVAGLLVFGDSLPLPATPGLYPLPLALAALYGLLTAGVFALWPLGRAARIPGAALFREAALPARRAAAWRRGRFHRRAGGDPGGADRARRTGPDIRAVLLHRRAGDPCRVSRWRLGADGGRPPSAPRRRRLAAAGDGKICTGLARPRRCWWSRSAWA